MYVWKIIKNNFNIINGTDANIMLAFRCLFDSQMESARKGGFIVPQQSALYMTMLIPWDAWKQKTTP